MHSTTDAFDYLRIVDFVKTHPATRMTGEPNQVFSSSTRLARPTPALRLQATHCFQRLLHRLALLRLGHAEVHLRGVRALMAQQLLHHAQVGAALHEMSRLAF